MGFSESSPLLSKADSSLPSDVNANKCATCDLEKAPADADYVECQNKAPAEADYVASQPNTLPQYVAGIVASLTAASAGLGMVYSSSVIGNIHSSHYHGELHLTESGASWLGSVWGLGLCFGNLCSGIPLRVFGRKRVLMFGMVPFIMGWACYAFAQNCILLFCGRILTSWAAGFAIGPAQLYVTEICQPDIRGIIGTFPMLLKTVGMLTSYAIGAVVDFRMLSWSSAILPLLVLFVLFWMPESPKWLVNQKRIHDAEDSLHFLRGKHYNCTRELNIMQRTQRAAERDKIGLAMLCRSQYLHTILISAMLMAVFVLSGVNNVLIFAWPIFIRAGVTSIGALSPVMLGAVQCLGFLASTFIVDKCRRRVLLLYSISAVAISLIALGFFFHMKNNGHDVSELQWLPISIISVYIFSFSVGVGPLSFVIMGEILPTQVREIGSTIACSFLALFTFGNAVVMHPLFSLIGEHGTFWLYSLFCMVGGVVIWLTVPETKGRSLEEIEQMLQNHRRRLSSSIQFL